MSAALRGTEVNPSLRICDMEEAGILDHHDTINE